MPRLAHRLLGITLALAALPAFTFHGGPEAAPDSASTRKGPPWISIEYPANPHDPASRGALLIVNTFHHGTPMAFPIAGTAEGVVNGDRRSVKLEFRGTTQPGRYALHAQWPREGTWVLVIRSHPRSTDGATALVALNRDGSVASVDVPSRQQDGWTVPREVTDAEVDALLARRVAAAR